MNFEPAVGEVLGVDVAERAVRLLVVQLFVEREERVVERARLAGAREVVAVLHVRPVEPRRRVEPREVVEVRRRAEQAEEEAVHVVAALRQVAARVGEREVAADREPVGEVMVRVQARRGPIEEVVRPDEHAFIVVVVPRQVERRPVVAA